MRYLITLMLLITVQSYAKFDRINNIVTDSKTNLHWQDDYSDNDNKIKKSNWKDAVDYCEKRDPYGSHDWRLPNKNELFSIIDYSKNSPSLDTHFKSNESNSYWTSSTYPSDKSKAWAVYFDHGSVSASEKTENNFVRCVKAGK